MILCGIYYYQLHFIDEYTKVYRHQVPYITITKVTRARSEIHRVSLENYHSPKYYIAIYVHEFQF